AGTEKSRATPSLSPALRRAPPLRTTAFIRPSPAWTAGAGAPLRAGRARAADSGAALRAVRAPEAACPRGAEIEAATASVSASVTTPSDERACMDADYARARITDGHAGDPRALMTAPTSGAYAAPAGRTSARGRV